MITGRLAAMQRSTIRRCALGIASAGSSTPRSAPGDHHPVRSLDDFVQVVDPLLVLDLGDDLDRTVVTVENLLHGMHVPGAPHEGVSDEIDVVLHGPFDEAAVFFRHRRQVDLHPRHIDALARPQRAAPHELAHQLLVGLVRHAEFHSPSAINNRAPTAISRTTVATLK